jgi:hypothetical protein
VAELPIVQPPEPIAVPVAVAAAVPIAFPPPSPGSPEWIAYYRLLWDVDP